MPRPRFCAGATPAQLRPIFIRSACSWPNSSQVCDRAAPGGGGLALWLQPTSPLASAAWLCCARPLFLLTPNRPPSRTQARRRSGAGFPPLWRRPSAPRRWLPCRRGACRWTPTSAPPQPRLCRSCASCRRQPRPSLHPCRAAPRRAPLCRPQLQLQRTRPPRHPRLPPRP